MSWTRAVAVGASALLASAVSMGQGAIAAPAPLASVPSAAGVPRAAGIAVHEVWPIGPSGYIGVSSFGDGDGAGFARNQASQRAAAGQRADEILDFYLTGTIATVSSVPDATPVPVTLRGRTVTDTLEHVLDVQLTGPAVPGTALDALAVVTRSQLVADYLAHPTLPLRVMPGTGSVDPSITDAVHRTSDQIRTYAGSPVTAPVIDDNGGQTGAGSPSQPYLVAARDLPGTTFVTSTRPVVLNAPGTTSLTITRRDGIGLWGGRVLEAQLTSPGGVSVVSGAELARLLQQRSPWLTLSVPNPATGITQYWLSHGGFAAFGDYPQEQQPVDGWVAAPLPRGTIWWSSGTGALLQHGAIGSYASLHDLGHPLDEERPVGGAVEQSYPGTTLVWSPGTMTTPVVAGFRDHYAAMGGPASWLGAPVQPEQAIQGGSVQFFQGGQLTWSAAAGVQEVHLGISGGNEFPPGPALGPERALAPGVVIQDFGWCSIVWTPSSRSQLGPGIADRYSLPGTAAWIGAPVDRMEQHVGWSSGVMGATVVTQRGMLIWSERSGTHVLGAGMAAAWRTPGVSTMLGWPVSEEYAVPGGMRQDFAFGFIVWQSATGALTWTDFRGVTHWL